VRAVILVVLMMEAAKFYVRGVMKVKRLQFTLIGGMEYLASAKVEQFTGILMMDIGLVAPLITKNLKDAQKEVLHVGISIRDVCLGTSQNGTRAVQLAFLGTENVRKRVALIQNVMKEAPGQMFLVVRTLENIPVQVVK